MREPLTCSVCGSTEHLKHFDGRTYEPELDHERLGKQLQDVRSVMARGEWLTLHEIAERTGYPEASISARLRDLRKERFGSHDIQRRRVAGHKGLHEYRLAEAPAVLEQPQMPWAASQ